MAKEREVGSDHNQYRVDSESKKVLKSAIGRIEKLDEERQAISDDIKNEYDHLKVEGFNVPAIRKIVAERKARKKNEEKFDEIKSRRDLYKQALGML